MNATLRHPSLALLAAAFMTLFSPVSVRGLHAAETAPKSDDSKEKTKYELRYQFRPGEVVRTKVLQQVRLDTTIAGSTQVAETTSGSVKIWKIADVDDKGQTKFEYSVDRVDMRQRVTGRQEVVYNSETDKTPPAGFEMVAQSVGVPLSEITIDGAGRIVKRIEKRPNAPSDSQGNQMVAPLPEGPVAIGESWNVPVDVPITLEGGAAKIIKTRQHYTLEKVSHGVATISVTTQILTPVNNPKIQSQLVQRLTKGTIRFDIEAGRVLSQLIELDERVLGFSGNESSLHYLGRFTEEYVPAEEKLGRMSEEYIPGKEKTAARPMPQGK